MNWWTWFEFWGFVDGFIEIHGQETGLEKSEAPRNCSSAYCFSSCSCCSFSSCSRCCCCCFCCCCCCCCCDAGGGGRYAIQLFGDGTRPFVGSWMTTNQTRISWNVTRVNWTLLTWLAGNPSWSRHIETTNPFLTQPEYCPDAFLTYESSPNIICNEPAQVPKCYLNFLRLWGLDSSLAPKGSTFSRGCTEKTILVHRMNQERMILVKDQSCRLWSFDRMIVFYTSWSPYWFHGFLPMGGSKQMTSGVVCYRSGGTISKLRLQLDSQSVMSTCSWMYFEGQLEVL